MRKTVMSFRFSDEMIIQLMELEKLELELKTKYNLKQKTKTEIIEEAISEYYVARMQNRSGHTYFNYIETRLSALLEDYTKTFVEAFNLNQIQNMKNTELILLFFKLLKVDIDKEKVDKALLMNSYIEEKVDEKNKKVYKRI